jgi:hypothetical protein
MMDPEKGGGLLRQQAANNEPRSANPYEVSALPVAFEFFRPPTLQLRTTGAEQRTRLTMVFASEPRR